MNLNWMFHQTLSAKLFSYSVSLGFSIQCVVHFQYAGNEDTRIKLAFSRRNYKSYYSRLLIEHLSAHSVFIYRWLLFLSNVIYQ